MEATEQNPSERDLADKFVKPTSRADPATDSLRSATQTEDDVWALRPTTFITHKFEDFSRTISENTPVHLRMIVVRLTEANEPEFFALQIPATARTELFAAITVPTIVLEEASSLSIIQNISSFLEQRLGLAMARLNDWCTEIAPKGRYAKRLLLSYLITAANSTMLQAVADEQIERVFWLGKGAMQDEEDGVQIDGIFDDLFRMAGDGKDGNKLYTFLQPLRVPQSPLEQADEAQQADAVQQSDELQI